MDKTQSILMEEIPEYKEVPACVIQCFPVNYCFFPRAIIGC